MRDPLFDPKAAKQTVSVTLNSDLYAKAKAMGINTSKVAEEALATKYAELSSEVLRAELQRGLAAVDAYAEQHGSFADLSASITSRTMAQFDVFVNPIVASRRSYPFVVALQSDLAQLARDQIVAPLVPLQLIPKVDQSPYPNRRIWTGPSTWFSFPP